MVISELKNKPSWPIPLLSHLFICHSNIWPWPLCLCDSAHHLGFILSLYDVFFNWHKIYKSGLWHWDGA